VPENAEKDRLITEFVRKWGFSNAEADTEFEQDVRTLIAAVKRSPPLADSAFFDVTMPSRRITFEDV
jgi:hypothetical protein